jgi:hypothetical protein
MIQTPVYKWKAPLAHSLLMLQSFFRLQSFPFFYQLFSLHILKYHEIQQGTSKSMERICNVPDILFETCLDAYLECFFDKYYTFLGNGWHVGNSKERTRSQGSCQNLPRKCPNCRDGGLILPDTSRSAPPFHQFRPCFHHRSQSFWVVFWVVPRGLCLGSR